MAAYVQVKNLLNDPSIMSRPSFAPTKNLVQQMSQTYESFNQQAHGYGLQTWYKDELQASYLEAIAKIVKDNPIATTAATSIFQELKVNATIPTK